MNNQTLEKLRQMRLFGMHDAFKTSLENTIKEKMTQDQFVSHLVHSEWDNRKNRAVERAVRAAQFRYNATLDDVDYTFERGLDRNQVERLAAMEFVRDHKDLIITGPTGTGKSYLATALGYKACQDGFRVMYASTAKLMSQLKISKAKGTILADLKLRGPGDLEGTQQSGIAFDLKIADIARDGQIVQMARDEAQKIIDNDPTCEKPEYNLLWNRLKELRKTNVNWAAIS
jgi:RecG-like helicase